MKLSKIVGLYNLIALHLLFDIVGWLVFNVPIKNKEIIIPLLTTSWLLYMYRDKFFKAFTSN
ncbi:hypothetical protein CO726_17475 [Bacillus fungorum]|uniref:Uncharacterized protein n=1 Tax=Bacillus fungorum TaxID=2039284 RepID=A0A2G6QCA5_9BACI|nr:hypothetical protein [Bacillus fungorum]PIE94000.1 hypothetical protein CO726_17475 [Bacillus fungorum]